MIKLSQKYFLRKLVEIASLRLDGPLMETFRLLDRAHAIDSIEIIDLCLDLAEDCVSNLSARHGRTRFSWRVAFTTARLTLVQVPRRQASKHKRK